MQSFQKKFFYIIPSKLYIMKRSEIEFAALSYITITWVQAKQFN